MDIVRKPRCSVHRNYHPPNTIRHRVKNGETWATIAKKYKIHPGELIELNFKTVDPQEVNWYMREYVGCSRLTADKMHYVFSSNDKPGIIHAPMGKQNCLVAPFTVKIDLKSNKKRVVVGLIEKETLYNHDCFGLPGKVMWTGSKRIIQEKYDWISKEHEELGMEKGKLLDYKANAFSKTSIRRYKIIWGPKDSTFMKSLKFAGTASLFLVKVLTNELEAGTGNQVYRSWKDYPKDISDPMNKFRPSKSEPGFHRLSPLPRIRF
jgi:hypothetical protein